MNWKSGILSVVESLKDCPQDTNTVASNDPQDNWLSGMLKWTSRADIKFSPVGTWRELEVTFGCFRDWDLSPVMNQVSNQRDFLRTRSTCDVIYHLICSFKYRNLVSGTSPCSSNFQVPPKKSFNVLLGKRIDQRLRTRRIKSQVMELPRCFFALESHLMRWKNLQESAYLKKYV